MEGSQGFRVVIDHSIKTNLVCVKRLDCQLDWIKRWLRLLSVVWGYLKGRIDMWDCNGNAGKTHPECGHHLIAARPKEKTQQA